MIKIIQILFLILLPAFHLIAQPYSEIKDIDILEDTQIVLEKEYPFIWDTLKILDITPLSDKLSKISFMDEGIYCEVVVHDNRKDMLLVASAVEIPKDEMPELIMHVVRDSEYGSWTIDRTLAVRTPYEAWFFAVDVSKDNKSERLFYDKMGTYKFPPYEKKW